MKQGSPGGLGKTWIANCLWWQPQPRHLLELVEIQRVLGASWLLDNVVYCRLRFYV